MLKFLLIYICICYLLFSKVSNLHADEICKLYNIKTLKQLKEKKKDLQKKTIKF